MDGTFAKGVSSMEMPQIFESKEFGKIRVVERSGAPWFVGKDVCDCLEIGNSRDAAASLDDDEKGVALIDTPGGKQEMSIISEPGLYSLVLRSRKAEAKRSNAELCMWSSRPYARPVAAVPRCFRTLGIRRRPRGRGRIMRSSGFSKNGSASCWSRG